MGGFLTEFTHFLVETRCSEVHLDIYDDRLTVTSPDGMYNELLIQNLNIADVSSERRNPILANVMAQLDYMENEEADLLASAMKLKHWMDIRTS